MWDNIPGGMTYDRVCGRCHFYPGRFTDYVSLPGRRAAFWRFMERHHAEDRTLRDTIVGFIRQFSFEYRLDSSSNPAPLKYLP